MPPLDTIMNYASPVGMGLSVASGLVGLLSGAAGRKKQNNLINEQQNWLDKEYLPDINRRYLDTVEAQSFISTLNTRMDEQNKQADQVAAVTGGTDEAVLSAKESNTKGYGESLNKLAGMGTQYKQMLKDRYMNGKNQLFGARSAMNQQQVASGANVFSNAMSSMGSMAMLPMLTK